MPELSDADGVRRLIVLAHWDPDCLIAPHVRYAIEALRPYAHDLVLISACELAAEDGAWARERARVIQRPNRGHDFASYRRGLAESELNAYDQVVPCNDSMVFPVVSPGVIFSEMRRRPVDFWGLTVSRQFVPHAQSFFVAFNRDALASPAFRRFWDAVSEDAHRTEVIHRYEIGLSQALLDARLTMGAYFTATPTDRITAALRTAYWDVGHVIRSRRWAELPRLLGRTALGCLRWNEAVALADRALDGGRLPFVKLEVFRFDPNRLDGRRLLGWCEEEFPDAFAGVRQYLERTDPAYGHPWTRRRALSPILPRYHRPRGVAG